MSNDSDYSRRDMLRHIGASVSLAAVASWCFPDRMRNTSRSRG